MFYHAYDNYIHKAYPYDELKPITCTGFDTWGSYSLTLVYNNNNNNDNYKINQ